MADQTGGRSRLRDRPRPPLTKRMRRGHWIALDCVAGAIAALLGVVPELGRPGPPLGPGFPFGPYPGRVPVLLVLLAAIFVSVGFRRVRPVPAYGALVLLGALLALGTQPSAPLVVLLAAGFVLYTVTVEAGGRTAAAALALGLVPVLMFFLIGQMRSGMVNGLAVPVAFVLLMCWLIGHSVRQRRLYSDTLQRQAASKAVTEERLRIARELHDVVAHSMSVIAVQAGFGQYVIDTSPEDARGALDAIAATSRDTLEEMRRMLGVLRQRDAAARVYRQPQQAAPLAPAPGLAGLDRLIERTSGTGVRVRLERSGIVRDLPAGVDLSAYRIVQEALTNVVRHAGAAASCTVSVEYFDQALVVVVTDDGDGRPARVEAVRDGADRDETAPASGGHGIIGMRERAALCGGSLEAGPARDGGFRVIATLPLHPTPISA